MKGQEEKEGEGEGEGQGEGGLEAALRKEDWADPQRWSLWPKAQVFFSFLLFIFFLIIF